MSRLLICCLLAGLAACDDYKPNQNIAAEQKSDPEADKPAPVSPVTGIKQIQNAHDEVRREIEKSEKAAADGKPAEAWLVKNQLKIVDNLTRACERARKEEAKQKSVYAAELLAIDSGKLHEKRDKLYEEMIDYQKTVAAHRKGTGKIPRGFTESELLDRAADLQVEIRNLETRLAEIKADLLKRKSAIESGKFEYGDSLFGREIEALAATRKRVAVLLPDE